MSHNVTQCGTATDRTKSTTNQNPVFRSGDWLSANQGPVFADSVGPYSVVPWDEVAWKNTFLSGARIEKQKRRSGANGGFSGFTWHTLKSSLDSESPL